jgi:NAD(P)-dependent dehydrogenase (short-subunit alcohol dehydrogenase family)
MAGSRVQYYQADVRNEQVLAHLVEEVYGTFGRIDGVIHGAGVIEDKLLWEKSAESFDRVFDTKADSAFILSRALRADSLKFLVFFSSISGCFGNRGQADYAAANAILSELAIYLDRRWPGRVVSICWGPWAKVGMVSAEAQHQFLQRGVQIISCEAGRLAFDRELRFGAKGEAEVVLGNGPWAQAEPTQPGPTRYSNAAPFFDGVAPPLEQNVTGGATNAPDRSIVA